MSEIDTSTGAANALATWLMMKARVSFASETTCEDMYQGAQMIEALAAERDRLREALDYSFKEMTGAYNTIDGHFSASEIELDHSIADAHAGLHVAIHTAAIVLKETDQ